MPASWTRRWPWSKPCCIEGQIRCFKRLWGICACPLPILPKVGILRPTAHYYVAYKLLMNSFFFFPVAE
jgi:hypothetical protein